MCLKQENRFHLRFFESFTLLKYLTLKIITMRERAVAVAVE